MSTQCLHESFYVQARVARLSEDEGGPVTNYQLDLTVRCTQCQTLFKFLGLPCGMDMGGAATSVDRTEARLAISPDGLPSTNPFKGFRVRGPDA